MTPKRTLATTRRVLRQLKHDRRTIGLMFGLPTVLMGLLAWMVADQPGAFDHWGPPILGIFPLIIMFAVTSVATLRERTSGTLERILAMPIGRGDLLGGYVLAFGLLGIVQAAFISAFAFWAFGMEIPGSPALLAGVAIADAILGTAMGLAASAVSRTEFQAVQMMPLLLFPQLFLCGLIVPLDAMPDALQWIAHLVPMTYAITAADIAIANVSITADYLANMGVVLGFIVLALVLGGVTLRRRTP